MEGWKHQARRDGLRGEEESEKGKETDHWAWKAGRRGRRALPEAAQHMKLQGEEQIILQHQSVSAQSVPHPLCRFCSLLLPARQQFCFHYGGGNWSNYTSRATAQSLPVLLAEAAQGMEPQNLCKSKASLFAFLQRGTFEDSPMDDLIIPIKKNPPCNSL